MRTFILSVLVFIAATCPYLSPASMQTGSESQVGIVPQAVFSVTNTNDSGAGSLRQALLDARTSPGSDTVAFNIPTTGAVPVIKPATPLPALDTGGITLDGTTQFRVNPNGPNVFLDLSVSGALKIQSANNNVRGLGFFRSPGAGIEISGQGALNNIVEGCFLGTNFEGNSAQANKFGILISGGAVANLIGTPTPVGTNVISGNSDGGIVIDGAGTRSNLVRNNVIGLNPNAVSKVGNDDGGVILRNGASSNFIGGLGAFDGNIVSGNTNGTPGILMTGTGTDSNVVQGNFIGTNRAGADLGNGGAGVRIVSGASRNLIGGASLGTGNIIAFNDRDGVTVGSSAGDGATQGNAVLHNSMYNNAGLAIDLGDDGSTANDPGDGDAGPNGLQNKPVITAVTPSGNGLTIAGQVDTRDFRTTVELFVNLTKSQQFLTSVVVQSNGAFTAVVPSQPAGFKISATATDSLNNTSEFSAAVSTTKQPDLNVESLTVSPTSVTAGNALSVVFNVRNENGAPTAPSSVAGVYLSTDNKITIQDALLTSLLTPALDGGKQTTLTASVVIPVTTAPGSFFLGVLADNGGTIDESDESNNTTSKSLKVLSPKADLTVGALSVSTDEVAPGGNLTVNLTVTNQGAQTASASTTQVRLSTNNSVNTSDTLLGSASTGSAASDSSLTLSIPVTIPDNTQPRNYFIGVILDSAGTVDEADEKNNTATIQLTVTGLGDLVVSALRVAPTTFTAGATVTVDFTIRNQGKSPTESTTHDVLFSNDNVIQGGEDLLLASRSTSQLQPNETISFSVSLVVPATVQAGTRFIGVLADSSRVADESSETNNTRSVAVTVEDRTPPVVAVVRPNIGEGLAAGRPFTIEWTASDNVAVTTQEIRFSADGGATFPTAVATGVSGEVRSFRWDVPVLNITTGRIQIVARDGAGNGGMAASAGNFVVAPPPIILTAKVKNISGKLVMTTTNTQVGAVLRVTVGTQTETFATNVVEGKTTVKPDTRSTPSGRTIPQLLPPGTAAAFVIVNPNNVPGDAFAFTR